MEIKIYYYNDHFIAKNIYYLFGEIPDNFRNNHFNEKNYSHVHSGVILQHDDNIHETLEKIFELFNSAENPLYHKVVDTRTHTSMSICDIILLNNKYYIVSSIGFKEI